MKPVLIPKETVNDDFYQVTEVFVPSGFKVKKGQTLLAVDTSKVSLDIPAPEDGFFYHQLKEAQRIPAGSVAGIIQASELSETEIQSHLSGITASLKGEGSVNAVETKFTKSAQALLAQHQIDPKVFMGQALVTGKEVESYLNKRTPHSQSKQEPGSQMVAIDSHVLVLGGGGHAKMCLEILKRTKVFPVAGILDSRLDIGSEVLGVPVLGRDTELEAFFQKGYRLMVNGIGLVENHQKRAEIHEKIRRAGFIMPNLIHPDASIDASVTLGSGNQIMAGAILGPHVQIGNGCILNSNCVVSHDTVIGNHVHVAPGALIAGSVQIGDRTLVGMGATIYLGLKVGSNVVIHNSSRVLQNLENNQVIK